MKRRTVILGSALAAAARAQPRAGGGSSREQVEATERSFAATMARRDHAAFTSHLSEEAIFFDGDKPIRGRSAVSAAWKGFFEGPTAPFSWAPEVVEVLDSGSLALSSGPVRNAKGEAAGRFTSIWRRESDGQWRIVFDKGSPACRCS